MYFKLLRLDIRYFFVSNGWMVAQRHKYREAITVLIIFLVRTMPKCDSFARFLAFQTSIFTWFALFAILRLLPWGNIFFTFKMGVMSNKRILDGYYIVFKQKINCHHCTMKPSSQTKQGHQLCNTLYSLHVMQIIVCIHYMLRIAEYVCTTCYLQIMYNRVCFSLQATCYCFSRERILSYPDL